LEVSVALGDFEFRLDDREFQRHTAELGEKGVRTAASWALNDTASDVLDQSQARMEVVFDKPTRFTKNAFTVRGARVSKLEATVTERPSVGRRHYLKVQEEGGRRGQTGLEKLLDSRLAFDGQITSVVPASGARLNQYGNWSTGQRNQALSGVKAQRDKRTNTTAASRKRNRKRAGFFVPGKGSKLSPGIWKRDTRGKISKIVHFTSLAPIYDKRLGFYDGVEDVYAERLPEHLRRTLAKGAARRAAQAG
jgi:hypothetical protein